MSTSPFEVPGYEILEKLGEGAMATIWKARQLSLDRIVAIKILRPEWHRDVDAMASFRKEAMGAARLKHSGIIQMFDAGESANAVYFIMEYVEGYTIGESIHQNGPMDEATALTVALSVAMALNYAWKTGQMIHCDIKPDNIMIDHDGTVKVADLGLARALGPTANGGEAGYIVGTPNYISPEQARGEANLDCGTDIYALGATLYHMVTGRLPFGDTPGTAPLARQQTDFLLDPLDLNPNLTPALGALIERLMIKDRQLRPSSWEKIIADLQEVRDGYLPLGDLPPPGASTVLCSSWRAENPGQQRPPATPKSKPTSPPPTTPQKPRKTLKITGQAVQPHQRRQQHNWAGIAIAIILLGVAAYAGAYLSLKFSGKLPTHVEKSVFAPVHKLYGIVSNLLPAPPPATNETDTAMMELEARLLHPVTTGRQTATASNSSTNMDSTATNHSAAGISSNSRKPHSALYRRAMRFHDFECTVYRQYNGQMSLPVTELIEKACRQATSDFNACREAQSNKKAVEPYIQRCYQLLADAQLSAKVVTNTATSSTGPLPPLPSMDLPAENPPAPATTP